MCPNVRSPEGRVAQGLLDDVRGLPCQTISLPDPSSSDKGAALRVSDAGANCWKLVPHHCNRQSFGSAIRQQLGSAGSDPPAKAAALDFEPVQGGGFRMHLRARLVNVGHPARQHV